MEQEHPVVSIGWWGRAGARGLGGGHGAESSALGWRREEGAQHGGRQQSS